MAMEMKFTEYPDMDALGDVLMSNWLRNDNSTTNEGDCIKGYYIYWQACSRGSGSVSVTYKQRLYNGVPYGRFYPDYGRMKSCTYQWSAARSAMFKNTETDIDIVNCHPTILNHICQTNGVSAPKLDEYVRNRDKFINNLNISKNEINSFNNITHSDWTQKSAGKFVFTALLYGASMKRIQETLHLSHTPIKAGGCSSLLYKEMQALKKSVVGLPCYAKLVSDITTELTKNNETVHDGRLLSFILQEAERETVQRAIAFFNHHGNSPVTSCIYDGFQIKCKDTVYIQHLLDELNAGSYLKFIMKEFPTPIQDLSFPQEARTTEQCMEDWENLSTINVEGFYTAKERVGKPLSLDPDMHIASNDYEASMLFLEHHKDQFVKTCNDENFCYVLVDNCWEQGVGSLLHMVMEFDIRYPPNDKGFCATYSRNIKNAKNIIAAIISNAPVDVDFVRRNNESIKDFMFYNNYIFSFKDKKFLTYDECPLRPFIKVKIDIEPYLLPLDHKHITTLKDKIFCCFADEDEIDNHLKIQARIISGHYEDKFFVLFIGQRNSGKGVIIELNSVAFQKYVTDVTLPVAKATASTDIAASNRWVLTQNHHIARLAYGNEVAVLANKPAVLDGEVLKKVIASGGDNVSARVMYGNEISVRVNTVSVFAVNESLSANPPNAMETCRLQCTSLSFGAPDPSSDFSGAVKKDDPNIKSWLHNTPWVPHAYLSLLAHYWGTTPASKLVPPESFRLEQKHVIRDNSDPLNLFSSLFTKDSTESMLCSDVQDLLSSLNWSPKRITQWLKAAGIEKKLHRVAESTTYFYIGLKNKTSDTECIC